jgi:hypothetical protein
MPKTKTAKKASKLVKVKPELQTVLDTTEVTEAFSSVLESYQNNPTLIAFRDMVDNLIATHGPTAELVLSHDSYDVDCVLEWFVEFVRDETPEEMKSRLQAEKNLRDNDKKYAAQELRYEKKEYLRLKKKFG